MLTLLDFIAGGEKFSRKLFPQHIHPLLHEADAGEDGRASCQVKAMLEEATARGEFVVLDIDVQGARQIRTAFPEALLVFVIPPSAEVLVSRLTKRGTEADEEVVRRLRNARKELARATDFDHVVVNDDLERAVEEVRTAARSGDARKGGDVADRIAELTAEIDRVLEERYQNVGA